MIKKLLAATLMFAFVQASAQKTIWHKLNLSEKKVISNTKKSYNPDGDVYELDLGLFRKILLSATGKQAKSITVNIPARSGKIEEYYVWESSNFAPELQAQFP